MKFHFALMLLSLLWIQYWANPRILKHHRPFRYAVKVRQTWRGPILMWPQVERPLLRVKNKNSDSLTSEFVGCGKKNLSKSTILQRIVNFDNLYCARHVLIMC